MPRKNTSQQNGFTILELAMVLGIIGLIIGGLVATKAIIRTSQLRQVLVEYDKYVKAVQEFQDKYHALPGDMSDATDIWGEYDDCDSTIKTTFDSVTCNGDGDGTVENAEEYNLFWQHLSNAGFIEGKYTGGYTAAYSGFPGINRPKSALDGGGWSFLYYTPAGNALWSEISMQTFHLGKGSGALYSEFPVMTTGEARALDEKIDDGKPGTGIVQTWRGYPNCVDNDTSATAQTYKVHSGSSANTNYCMLVFIPGF